MRCVIHDAVRDIGHFNSCCDSGGIAVSTFSQMCASHFFGYLPIANWNLLAPWFTSEIDGIAVAGIHYT